jgi:heme/copper-type cytochrome/quinol oxidase subunit 2
MLPVDTTIRVLVTADDVIHSWAVPAFGVKRDAVPGRINETWIRIERQGVYYGQCSQLCGQGHAFLPITVEAVSKDRFPEMGSGSAGEVRQGGRDGTGGRCDRAVGNARAGLRRQHRRCLCHPMIET